MQNHSCMKSRYLSILMLTSLLELMSMSFFLILIRLITPTYQHFCLFSLFLIDSFGNPPETRVDSVERKCVLHRKPSIYVPFNTFLRSDISILSTLIYVVLFSWRTLAKVNDCICSQSSVMKTL